MALRFRRGFSCLKIICFVILISSEQLKRIFCISNVFFVVNSHKFYRNYCSNNFYFIFEVSSIFKVMKRFKKWEDLFENPPHLSQISEQMTKWPQEKWTREKVKYLLGLSANFARIRFDTLRIRKTEMAFKGSSTMSGQTKPNPKFY